MPRWRRRNSVGDQVSHELSQRVRRGAPRPRMIGRQGRRGLVVDLDGRCMKVVELNWVESCDR